MLKIFTLCCTQQWVNKQVIYYKSMSIRMGSLVLQYHPSHWEGGMSHRGCSRDGYLFFPAAVCGCFGFSGGWRTRVLPPSCASVSGALLLPAGLGVGCPWSAGAATSCCECSNNSPLLFCPVFRIVVVHGTVGLFHPMNERIFSSLLAFCCVKSWLLQELSLTFFTTPVPRFRFSKSFG